MQTVLGSELRLADVVRLGDYAFADAIVTQITPTEVKIRRPYMLHCDFAHSGGVITSVNFEEWQRPITDTFVRVQRGGSLK